jgi:hypothetical protein
LLSKTEFVKSSSKVSVEVTLCVYYLSETILLPGRRMGSSYSEGMEYETVLLLE